MLVILSKLIPTLLNTDPSLDTKSISPGINSDCAVIIVNLG